MGMGLFVVVIIFTHIETELSVSSFVFDVVLFGLHVLLPPRGRLFFIGF